MAVKAMAHITPHSNEQKQTSCVSVCVCANTTVKLFYGVKSSDG